MRVNEESRHPSLGSGLRGNHARFRRMTSMKRRVLTVVVFLLLGAIVNVAVAWGFASRRAALNIERNWQGYFVIWNRPWQVVEERRAGMIDRWWYDLHHEESRSKSPPALIDSGNALRAERQASGRRMPAGGAIEALAAAPGWGTLRESP